MKFIHRMTQLISSEYRSVGMFSFRRDPSPASKADLRPLRAPHGGVRRLTANSGFTLLLAALVSSIVLAVGAAIFGIAQKQLLLSAIGRDSQFAFYAADTAAECALYWDFRCNYFASSTALINPACSSAPVCDTELLEAEGRPTAEPYYPYTMTSQQMDFFQDATVSGNLCAQVSVTKCQGTFDADGDCVVGSGTDSIRTIIHADGYSTNCASILTSTRALQRSVELHY